MTYSDDSPHVKAAKASGAARRERAERRRAAEERRARALTPGHHESCRCDQCLDVALAEADRIANVSLTATNGIEQWKRWVHSRCNGSDIRCPWCDALRGAAPPEQKQPRPEAS